MRTMNFVTKYKYPLGLALLALVVFVYIFNAKIDFNGDNCYYYIFASSLAAGNGYTDVMGNATALFPPGYPLLMALVRFFTASVVAQKVFNLVLLFAAVLLLFFILLGEKVRQPLAFVACAAVLVTPHLLEFSTMMMSEASCIFFIMLSLYSFGRLPREGSVWRSPWLWVFLFATVYTFYIRTQAVVFVGAVVVALLCARRFKVAAAAVAAFVLGYAPWALRNVVLGVGQSRYMSQIDFSNVWGNARMLLVQALPESVVPFFDVNYAARPSALLVAIAVAMLAVMFYGFWQLKGLRVLLPLFFAGNIAIVAIMNTPSYYRYMVIALPLITAGLLVGFWGLCNAVCQRFLRRGFSPWFLLLLLIPLFVDGSRNEKHNLQGLNAIATDDYPPFFKNFLAIGENMRNRNVLVACRKPELFYVHSGIKSVRLGEYKTSIEILNDMVDRRIDYLLLENMGFRYTYEKLYPLATEYEKFFTLEMYTAEPENLLFRFHRREAENWLRQNCYRW